jgi:hypothetical protein
MNYLLDHLTLKHLFLFLMVIVIIKMVGLINHYNVMTFSPPLPTTNNKKRKPKIHKKTRKH